MKHDSHKALAIVSNGQTPALVDMVRRHWYALTEQHFSYFRDTAPVRRDLIPLPDLQAMLPVLAEMAKPAERNTAVGHMAMLIGAFPHVNVPDLEVYTKTLTKYAQTYPADVLETGVDAMLRTLKFPPSIQELTEALDKIVEPIRMAEYRAKRMIELHAECDKAEARQEEMRRESAAKLEAFKADHEGRDWMEEQRYQRQLQIRKSSAVSKAVRLSVADRYKKAENHPQDEGQPIYGIPLTVADLSLADVEEIEALPEPFDDLPVAPPDVPGFSRIGDVAASILSGGKPGNGD